MDLSFNNTPSTRTVLITQGITPFAQRIATRFFPQWKVVFASSAEVPQLLLDTGRHFLIPTSEHSSFIHEMLKMCLDHQVDHILPLDRGEAIRLSGAKVLFSEYGIDVLASDPEIMEEWPVMVQPPRGLDLVIVSKGDVLVPTSGMEGAIWPGGTLNFTQQYAGVFCFNDDGEGFQCYA